jgi:hypothetical protein
MTRFEAYHNVPFGRHARGEKCHYSLSLQPKQKQMTHIISSFVTPMIAVLAEAL